MNNIPSVFELARIYLNRREDPGFALTFEEYCKYAELYEQLPDTSKEMIDIMARSRKKT